MSDPVLEMLVSHLRATVEALEAHLSVGAAYHDEQRAPTGDEVRVVAEKIAEKMAASGWGEEWNRSCAAAVIGALDEYRRRRYG